MFHALVKLLVSLGPALLPMEPIGGARPEPLVLTHVTVIDATGAPAQPGMTVVIETGRIAAVGKTGQVPVPDGARVVNTAGKFLIPGLWDMHVHWYDEASLSLFPAKGVTGVRIMCGYPLHLRWRSEIAAGKLLGPRLVLAGPIVDGPQPVWPDSLRAATSVEGRRAVRTIKEQGYDCVKVYNLLPRPAYFGVAAEAKHLGLPCVGHVPFAVSAAEASDAGQKSIEHLTGVSLACSSREAEIRRQLVAVQDNDAAPTALLLRFEVEAEDSYDETKAAALFARFVKNGTWHVPTLIARRMHSLLGEKTSPNSSGLAYLPPSLKSRWDSRRGATLRKLGAADFANYKRSLRSQLELVGAMHRAGVGFLAGTDTGALDCLAGFALHDELELLVNAGLTPMEALQTATRNPAHYLGRQNDLGTIERGKVADLVLLDANPLEDIRNTTKIDAVVLGGRLLTRADLRAQLAAVEASCREVKEQEKPPGASPKYP
jgi:imidazolonepropionase-like amidohydrolase